MTTLWTTLPRESKWNLPGARSEIKKMYTIKKNEYHKFEKKGQTTMTFARPIRAKFQDLGS